LRIEGIDCYGILPMPLVEEDLKRAHGNDERVPISGVKEGLEFTYEIVRRLATQ